MTHVEARRRLESIVCEREGLWAANPSRGAHREQRAAGTRLNEGEVSGHMARPKGEFGRPSWLGPVFAIWMLVWVVLGVWDASTNEAGAWGIVFCPIIGLVVFVGLYLLVFCWLFMWEMMKTLIGL